MKPKLEQKAKREDTDGLLEFSDVEDGLKPIAEYVKNGIPKVIRNPQDTEFKRFQECLSLYCGLLATPDKSTATATGFNVKYRPSKKGQPISIERVGEILARFRIVVSSRKKIMVKRHLLMKGLNEKPPSPENSGVSQEIGNKGEKLIFLDILEKILSMYGKNDIKGDFETENGDIIPVSDFECPFFEVFQENEFILDFCWAKNKNRNYDIILRVIDRKYTGIMSLFGVANQIEKIKSENNFNVVYFEVKSSEKYRDFIELSPAQCEFSKEKDYIVCSADFVNDPRPMIQYQKLDNEVILCQK